MPGCVGSEQFVHALSLLNLSEVEDCGLGSATAAAGGANWPLKVVQKIASPVPSAMWLAAVPPMIDWWKLSLSAYSSASRFNTGVSPCWMSKKPIELAPELSPREIPT